MTPQLIVKCGDDFISKSISSWDDVQCLVIPRNPACCATWYRPESLAVKVAMDFIILSPFPTVMADLFSCWDGFLVQNKWKIFVSSSNCQQAFLFDLGVDLRVSRVRSRKWSNMPSQVSSGPHQNFFTFYISGLIHNELSRSRD